MNHCNRSTNPLYIIFLVKILFLCFISFLGTGCNSSDNNNNKNDKCEIVINANGPGFLKVINNTNGYIFVYLPEYALGAVVRPKVCEMYGMKLGSRKVEISICEDELCDNWDSTQKQTILIEDGLVYEISVDDNFFQTTNKDYSTNCYNFYEQESYEGDCNKRPAGSICVGFEDGYIWLIFDSLDCLRGYNCDGEGAIWWGVAGSCDGNRILLALGKNYIYYHIENTNLVKQIPR